MSMNRQVSAQLIAAWCAYVAEFGLRETYTLLQLERAVQLSFEVIHHEHE
jgi:hypothetical protein